MRVARCGDQAFMRNSKMCCPKLQKHSQNATTSGIVGLKWVHMVRYGFILRQGRAIWLRIISGPLLTPKSRASGGRRVFVQAPGPDSQLYICRALAQGVSDHLPLDSNKEQHLFL